jgi:hypothetical protein
MIRSGSSECLRDEVPARPVQHAFASTDTVFRFVGEMPRSPCAAPSDKRCRAARTAPRTSPGILDVDYAGRSCCHGVGGRLRLRHAAIVAVSRSARKVAQVATGTGTSIWNNGRGRAGVAGARRRQVVNRPSIRGSRTSAAGWHYMSPRLRQPFTRPTSDGSVIAHKMIGGSIRSSHARRTASRTPIRARVSLRACCPGVRIASAFVRGVSVGVSSTLLDPRLRAPTPVGLRALTRVRARSRLCARWPPRYILTESRVLRYRY